jgi:hypothetical protein
MAITGYLSKLLGASEMDKDPSAPLESVDDQSPDEKKLAAFIRQRVEDVRSTASRVAHEATWMVNTAYLLGYDNVMFDTVSRQFQSINATGVVSKTKIHVNTILPTVQNRLARLCKNPPKYDIKPNSPKAEDKDAARLSSQVLGQLWEKLALNKKRISLYMWVQQCGYGFIKIGWDPLAGKQIADPLNPEDCDYEGEIKAEVVSPFEVFVDPFCKDDFEEAQWLVHARVRKLDYFRSQYPERGALVTEEDAWLLSLQYENRINSISSDAPFSNSQSQQMKNSAIEMAYYEKPSRKFKGGRFVIVGNGVILEDKELQIDEISFSKFDDIIVAGKFDSESIITHLRPLNDQFNRVVSKRADFFNKMMAGKYIAPRGSKLMQESLTDENSELVEYSVKPNHPAPQALIMPQIPAYAYKESDEFKQMHYDISGIGEISRGTLPSAGIPAIGMQFLQEQDETRLGVESELIEHAWARVGRHILKFANRYYKTERMLTISGRNQDYIIKYFKGQDLKNHFDVTVIRGSTLPGSKVLRRQEILNARDQGLFGDPTDPKVIEKILGMIEFGDTEGLWEDYSLDMHQIQRAISMLEEGQPPPFHELDNHILYLQELNRYRKTDKYDALAHEPMKKMLFEGFMEAHVQAMVRLQNPNIAADEAMNNEGKQVHDAIMANPDKYSQFLNDADQGEIPPDAPQGFDQAMQQGQPSQQEPQQ